MKTYRCKHTVEAMRWTNTDDDREAFSWWFEGHGLMFETRGPIAILPEINVHVDDGDHNHVMPGEWIVWMDGEFLAMTDEQFKYEYEENA